MKIRNGGFTLIERIGQVKPDASRKQIGKLSGSHLTYNEDPNKVYRLGVSPTGAARRLNNVARETRKSSGLHPTYREGSGFTLIEVLVVVLIIGILAAVALPQYQKAILKSRYSAMMPIGKAVADGNEVYYMEHGNYASDLKALSVQGQDEYPDGTKLEFGDTDDYAYVLASNTDKTPHNTYVVYQKHSKNFPDNIHCEAFDQDEKATWLCRDGLHGTKIETGEIKSLSGEGYSAYLLSGSTTGSTFDKSCEGEAETITQTCPGGCGKLSGTATCNPYTGEWEAPTLDESSCPTKPADETASCSAGDGQKTRSAKCNADGTAWEWDSWDESACCTGTPPSTTNATTTRCTGSNTGTTPICVNGQWQFTSFNSNLTCDGSTTTVGVSCSTSTDGASNGGACTGTYKNAEALCTADGKYGCAGSYFEGGFHKPVSGYTGYAERASCQANAEYGCANSEFVGSYGLYGGAYCNGEVANGCNGSTFKAVSGQAWCAGNTAYGCANTTFEGVGTTSTNYAQAYCLATSANGCSNATFTEGAYCSGRSANGCAGSTFKSSSYCSAETPGACDNVTYAGGCCAGEYCPSGAPKCTVNYYYSNMTITHAGTW